MSKIESRRQHVQRHLAGRANKTSEARNEKPAWCFFAPQNNSNRVTLSGAAEGKSCYLLQLSKSEHNQPIASVKSDAVMFWGTRRGAEATLAASGPSPAGSVREGFDADFSRNESCNAAHLGHPVRTPAMDMLSVGDRRRWHELQRQKNEAIKQNESGLNQRRCTDRSVFTLDNSYRQFVPKQSSKPLMNDIMSGAFMESTQSRSRPRPNHIALNRREVRAASAVVRDCRSSGMFQ